MCKLQLLLSLTLQLNTRSSKLWRWGRVGSNRCWGGATWALGNSCAVSHWPAGSGPWPIAGGRVVMATGTLTRNSRGRTARGRAGTMAQNLYGPGVRMGNWNEDVYLEEVQRTWPDAPSLAAEEHPHALPKSRPPLSTPSLPSPQHSPSTPTISLFSDLAAISPTVQRTQAYALLPFPRVPLLPKVGALALQSLQPVPPP